MPTGRLWTLGIKPGAFQLGDDCPNDRLLCPPRQAPKNSNNPVLLLGITDVKFIQNHKFQFSSSVREHQRTPETWGFFPRENLFSKDSVSSGMVGMVGMRLSGMTTWTRLFSSDEERRALAWGRAPSRFSPPCRLLWTEAEAPSAPAWSLESLMASS